MAFWSEISVEPKRQFKFKVTFPGMNGANNASNDGVFLAQSADRPMYTISDGTKVDFLDKSFHFPGKITWNQVKIKFVDAVGAAGGVNAASKAYEFLRISGYVNPMNMQSSTGLGTIGKSSAVTAITGQLGVAIEVLNSAGSQVDKWILYNAWIANVNLNNLDYASEAILTVELTLRYDWADLTAGV